MGWIGVLAGTAVAGYFFYHFATKSRQPPFVAEQQYSNESNHGHVKTEQARTTKGSVLQNGEPVLVVDHKSETSSVPEPEVASGSGSELDNSSTPTSTPTISEPDVSGSTAPTFTFSEPTQSDPSIYIPSHEDGKKQKQEQEQEQEQEQRQQSTSQQTSQTASKLSLSSMPPPSLPVSKTRPQSNNTSSLNRSTPPSLDFPPSLPTASSVTSLSPNPPRLRPVPSSSLAVAGGGLPPRPNGSVGSSGGRGSLRPPPSAASSLRVPPQQLLSGTNMQPKSSIGNKNENASTSTLPPSKRASKKVILAPGHSPLDWAALQRDPDALVELRGQDAVSIITRSVEQDSRYDSGGGSGNGSANTNAVLYKMLRVTPSMLRRQTGRKGKDAWTTYQGKVYNITKYLPFHPGGEPELMRGAGRSSDQLFAEVHPWVNWEGMLSECLVGMYVSEAEAEAEAKMMADAKAGAELEAKVNAEERGVLDLDAMD